MEQTPKKPSHEVIARTMDEGVLRHMKMCRDLTPHLAKALHLGDKYQIDYEQLSLVRAEHLYIAAEGQEEQTHSFRLSVTFKVRELGVM